jgi:hypothetical protein
MYSKVKKRASKTIYNSELQGKELKLKVSA